MSSKIIVQRGLSSSGSARGKILMSPSESSGGLSTNAGHYVKPSINRQIADFGI